MNAYALLSNQPAFATFLNPEGSRQTFLDTLRAQIETMLEFSALEPQEDRIHISPALQTALLEIIAAIAASNLPLLFDLLGVKSYICSEIVEEEPFWENSPKDENAPSFYRILDGMSYATSRLVNQLPHGMSLLSSTGEIHSTPAPTHQSPTLDLMQQRQESYQRKHENA